MRECNSDDDIAHAPEVRRRHLAEASSMVEVIPKSSSIVAVAQFSRDNFVIV
jgi:hypothetical protein